MGKVSALVGIVSLLLGIVVGAFVFGRVWGDPKVSDFVKDVGAVILTTTVLSSVVLVPSLVKELRADRG